jgi:hypothetical protein
MTGAENRIRLEVDVRDATFPIVVDPLIWLESQRLIGAVRRLRGAGFRRHLRPGDR